VIVVLKNVQNMPTLGERNFLTPLRGKYENGEEKN
jgi:hypothetical protein